MMKKESIQTHYASEMRMNNVYNEQDLKDIKQQFRQRLIKCLIPAVLLLAGIVVSFVFRIEFLTIALSLVLGAFAIFVWSMALSPVRAYQKHLENVLHGITRELTGAFKEMDEEAVIRDGVRFYPMLLNVGDMNKEMDDRLFYYDAALPRPDWQKGEMLTIVSHDKNVGKWTRVE